MTQLKRVETVLPSPPMHWVGDGFPVRSVLTPQSSRNRVSPFLLFDYAGPAAFEPSSTPRGVDSHPHRGFETVTVVFQGELEHRDSAGHRGAISAGDVQWMTAASGVLHEEKHSRAFTAKGGVLEMAQLWVNLPASHKMSPPRYQELRAGMIPVVPLGEGAGSARIIAGAFDGTRGAAETVTPVILWDLRIAPGKSAHLPIPEKFNAALYVRSGSGRVGEGHAVKAGELVVFESAGAGANVQAESAMECLVIGGQPIDEPVAAYGPFVMNTAEEVQQAIEDFRAGRFGQL